MKNKRLLAINEKIVAFVVFIVYEIWRNCFMRNKRVNKIMIIVVLFLFMLMGIGYSYLSKTLGVSGNVTVKSKLCKRADPSTLHIEECKAHSGNFSACDKLYSVGDTITYGNKNTTKGELTSGDAFDCDVDGNGVYDSNTERFYYVSDYYDTTTKSFNDKYATLIYYNNVKVGKPDNVVTLTYDASNENWHGPVTGYVELPSTKEWSKVTLLNETRQLLNENAGNTAVGGILTTFTYTDKVARLLTVQEINQGCNIMVGTFTPGELDTCEYLLENTWYSDPNLHHWWLETVLLADANCIWDVSGLTRHVGRSLAGNTTNHGIRPAIDVAKTNIDY